MADMDEVVGTVVAEVVVAAAAVSQRPTLPRLVALGGRQGRRLSRHTGSSTYDTT